MTRYMRWLDRGFETYEDLRAWSVEDLEGFWASIWEHFGVDGRLRAGARGPLDAGREVVHRRARSTTPSTPSAASRDDRVAIVHAGELRDQAEVTWGELREQVAGIAAGLRALGVERGDRVAAYMPNIPEAIAAFLATALDRRRLVELLARLRRPQRDRPLRADRAEGAAGGRRLPLQRQATSTARTPSRASTRRSAASSSGSATSTAPAGRTASSATASWSSSACRSTTRCGCSTRPAPPACRRRSCRARAGSCSSTSRSSTCTSNAQEGDRIFWFTTTGWMMWNFLVGCLLTEASIVLYDGSPGHPDMGVLWDLAESAGVTTFGTSASYIASCMKAEVEPGDGRDLSQADGGRLDRLAALARGLPLGLRARRLGHVAVLDQRRHRRLHGVRRRLPAAARSTRASCRRARSAARSSPGAPRASR